MEKKYNLIEEVDPNKVRVPIHQKFSKLTLSSKKKNTTPLPRNNDKSSDNEDDKENILSRKSHATRSLLKDLLTDDESENDADDSTMNRLFFSKPSQNVEVETIKKLDDNKTKNYSLSFNEKLELSDSDITNCSEYKSTNTSLDKSLSNKFLKNDDEKYVERLNVSDVVTKLENNNDKKGSESLFSTESSNQNLKRIILDDDLRILSSQIQQLEVKSPIRSIKNEIIDYDEKRTADADTLSVTTSFFIENEQKLSVLCPATPPVQSSKRYSTHDDSVYVIDSNSSVSISETNEEDNDEDDDEVIVISDSESERSCNVQVSDIKSSKQVSELSLPSTDENIRNERLQEFLDNIPPVQIGVETSQISNQNLHIQRFRSDLKDENEHLVEDSVEIEETSYESEEKSVDDAAIGTGDSGNVADKEQENPSTPKEKLSSKCEAEGTASRSQSPQSRDSGACVEQINISATIKIKFKMREPIIKYSSVVSSPESEDVKNTDENKNENVEEIKSQSLSENEVQVNDNDDGKDKARLSDAESQHTVDCERSAKNTPVMQGNLINESEDLNDKTQIDLAKDILTKLYGKEWQTPEVMSKLDRKENTVKHNEDSTSIGNFTNFHVDIHPELHSTKIEQNTFSRSILDDSANFKKPVAQVKPLTQEKEKDEDSDSSIEIRRTRRRRPVKSKPRKLNISSSSSGSKNGSQSDFDSDTDTSWKGSDKLSSSSTDSSTDLSKRSTRNTTRNVTKKKITRKKQTSKIIYLDLTDDCVKVQNEYKSPEVEKDSEFKSRLDTLLETCRYKERPKVPATPNGTTKTKRKLFTPRYDEDLIDEAVLEKHIKELEKSPTYKKAIEEDEDDIVKLRYPLPPAFTLFNKQLESVKTGTPVFKIQTPPPKENSGKKKTVSNESPLSENSKNTKITTPKGSSIPKTPASDKTSSTPLDKFGFLRSLDVTVVKYFCHPEALYYKENFKSKKDELTQKLYVLYNEKVFENKLNVNITWNKKLLTTAGRCFNKKIPGGERTSRIELSEKVVTSADRLRCTLIHEMCHAATWIFNGENGHNATWKGWASKANNIFPELPTIKVCHKYDIEYKYTYKCTLCQAKSYAHSKSKKTENIRCAYCHGAIEVFLNRRDKEGNVMHTPVREPTGFAKFVKENYKLYKTADRKHAEVMKILSNEFAYLDVKDKK